MKIGLVIERFDPERGGAEHWTYQHAMAMLDRGHEVHVVCESATAEADHRLFLHTFGQRRSRLERATAAEHVVSSLDLDVVHDIGLGWSGDILQSEDGSRFAQWDRMLKALPAAVRPIKRRLIRSLRRYRDFRTLMHRQYANPHRLIVAVSRMCAEDYRRYHQVPKDRIRLVYHGTDTKRFTPETRIKSRLVTRRQLGVADGEHLFLFVGHDFVRKGLASALQATKQLAATGTRARLLVAGQRKPNLRYPSRDGVHNVGHALFIGAVNDIRPYYAAADAFVLPTFYDPCSLTVGEAMACGLPTITTRYNGASEMITDGFDGFVLDEPTNVEQLRSQLERLTDKRLRDCMGKRARQTALRYPLERNCDEILSLYDEILDRQERRSIIAFPSRAFARPQRQAA